MDRKVKAVLWGVGSLGSLTAKFMLECKVDIVGAIGNKSNIGNDLGNIIGLDAPLNVKLSNDADAVLSDTKPDIVVICYGHLLEDVAPAFRKAAEYGVNAIAIPDGAFYPWRVAPELTEELDILAKKKGVTFSASGFQDVIWSALPAVLSGGAINIEAIELDSCMVLDGVGAEVFQVIPVGKSPDEFKKAIDGGAGSGMSIPLIIATESLIKDLGLTFASVTNNVTPIIAEQDYFAEVANIHIKKGHAIGFINRIEVKTKENLSVFLKATGIFSQGKTIKQANTWKIKGTPELSMEITASTNAFCICTGLVNRIPHVINSKPGYVCAVDMPKLTGMVKPMSQYPPS